MNGHVLISFTLLLVFYRPRTDPYKRVYVRKDGLRREWRGSDSPTFPGLDGLTHQLSRKFVLRFGAFR